MDWLDEDQDERQVEVRHYHKEQDAISKQQNQQGYLEGLDWADTHYMKLDGQLKPSFIQGFDLGMQASLSRRFKFESIGKLNV